MRRGGLLHLSRWNHATKQPLPPPLTGHQLDELLSTPTWDVRSLIPSVEQVEADQEVTPEQLRHLLRLSALPYPETPKQEATMLRALKAQLHFVGAIQRVDTTGIKPLQGLRDETEEAEREEEVGMESLRQALLDEEGRGKYHRRTRRKPTPTDVQCPDEQWDVLGQVPKRVGRFVVVDEPPPKDG